MFFSAEKCSNVRLRVHSMEIRIFWVSILVNWVPWGAWVDYMDQNLGTFCMQFCTCQMRKCWLPFWVTGCSVAMTWLDLAVTDLGQLLPNWEVKLAFSQVIGANGNLKSPDYGFSHDFNINLVIQEQFNTKPCNCATIELRNNRKM